MLRYIFGCEAINSSYLLSDKEIKKIIDSNKFGRSLLRHATQFKQKEIVDFLNELLNQIVLSEKALKAVNSGNLKEIQKIAQINVGILARIRSKDGFPGFSILHYACMHGHLGILKYLLNEVQDRIQFKEMMFLIVILQAPDNSNIKTAFAPLDCACGAGHIEIVRFILSPESIFSREEKRKILFNTNGKETTPLSSAALNGHLDIMKLILNDDSILTTQERLSLLTRRIKSTEYPNDLGDTILDVVKFHEFTEIVTYINMTIKSLKCKFNDGEKDAHKDDKKYNQEIEKNEIENTITLLKEERRIKATKINVYKHKIEKAHKEMDCISSALELENQKLFRISCSFCQSCQWIIEGNKL